MNESGAEEVTGGWKKGKLTKTSANYTKQSIWQRILEETCGEPVENK